MAKNPRPALMRSAVERVHSDRKGDPIEVGSNRHMATLIDLALIDIYGFRNIDAERKLEELSAYLRGNGDIPRGTG